MNWQRPTSAQLWKAIDLYLKAAYAGAAPPSAVRARLETLRSLADFGEPSRADFGEPSRADFGEPSRAEPDLYECAVFERDRQALPQRYSLRLGNRFYPHMKLCIERAPDGRQFLFRADSHDRHCLPERKSREYDAFARLMEDNQAVCHAIESAWDQSGLPTFKSYLRQDLARRKTQG